MARIEDAVNVGTGLAGQLRQLGIESIEQLREIGAVPAWNRLVDAHLRDDLPTLLALEGAVRGVRWKEITLEERDEFASLVEQRTGKPA